MFPIEIQHSFDSVFKCWLQIYTFMCYELTWYNVSTRHLNARVREYLDFNSARRSAMKDHILSCDICSDDQHGLKSFTVIKKYQSEFHTEIHET